MVGGKVAMLSVRPLREDGRDSWTPRQELREAPARGKAGGSCPGARWGLSPNSGQDHPGDVGVGVGRPEDPALGPQAGGQAKATREQQAQVTGQGSECALCSPSSGQAWVGHGYWGLSFL